jgi:regulatory protein
MPRARKWPLRWPISSDSPASKTADSKKKLLATQPQVANCGVFFYASLMFGKPRLLETEAQLYDAAIKILMRRAHSVSEMKKALARRCEDDKMVKAVVERLKRENLIDDGRYARQFTRHRTRTRKQGPFRIARELRARGVPDRHIETALEESANETDPAAIVRQRIERKLRMFRGEIDQKKLASLYRSLIGAGFPADLIRKELHRLTHEEVPEVETDPE